MKAYWYTEHPKSLYGNVGDMLTPIIIEHFTGKKPEFADKWDKGKLLACGSVAEFIMPGDTVWGSGLIQPMAISKFANKNVNILAVRGKRTADILREYGFTVPEVYGDPAVLMPEIYNPHAQLKRPWKTIAITHDIGYVPHYVEVDAWRTAYPKGFLYQ